MIPCYLFQIPKKFLKRELKVCEVEFVKRYNVLTAIWIRRGPEGATDCQIANFVFVFDFEVA